MVNIRFNCYESLSIYVKWLFREFGKQNKKKNSSFYRVISYWFCCLFSLFVRSRYWVNYKLNIWRAMITYDLQGYRIKKKIIRSCINSCSIGKLQAWILTMIFEIGKLSILIKKHNRKYFLTEISSTFLTNRNKISNMDNTCEWLKICVNSEVYFLRRNSRFAISSVFIDFLVCLLFLIWLSNFIDIE